MSKLRNIFKWSSGALATVASTLLSLLLVISSLSGYVDPSTVPLAGVAVMLLPVLTPVAIVLFVADAMWWRRATLILGIGLAVAMPSIVEVFPVGTGAFVETSRPGPAPCEFVLMSYNCAGFMDVSGEYPEGRNPAIKLILDEDADVVALQETYELGALSGFKVRSSDVDSLHMRYPYIIEDTRHRMTLLSKYPARLLEIAPRYEGTVPDEISAFALTVGGREMTLFSVHLRSIGLTTKDKELYGDITRLEGNDEGSRKMIGEVHRNLISKVAQAAASRSAQIRRLEDDIRRLGAHNIIVCGDFNDVPGCYAINSLNSLGLREVFPAVGQGYMATFNRDRLYFTIDHVLWRGDLHPLTMWRLKTYSSDHFPLFTHFRLD